MSSPVLSPAPAAGLSPRRKSLVLAVCCISMVVVVMDVSGLSPVTDYMVVATGTSPRQMRTAADDAQELGEPNGHRALARSEDPTGTWILMDFVDVVVHVFSQEARMYYDLDGLWGDAPRVPWERGQVDLRPAG